MKTRCHWIYTALNLSEFPGFLIQLSKNHSEFGKYSVLAMCRVNDMANKIKLDPKSVVRKSVTAALT